MATLLILDLLRMLDQPGITKDDLKSYLLDAKKFEEDKAECRARHGKAINEAQETAIRYNDGVGVQKGATVLQVESNQIFASLSAAARWLAETEQAVSYTTALNYLCQRLAKGKDIPLRAGKRAPLLTWRLL